MRRPRTLIALTLAAALLAPACTSENDLGKCVGIAQSDRRDPTLYYDLSVWNTFWGLAASPLLFPPILVLHHELYCPSGRRPPVAPPLPPTNALGETSAR